MNYTKLGNFEAVCLLTILFINHLVPNLPQMILDSSGTASALNVVYIIALALIFVLLIIKLFKKFLGLDIIDISEYLGGKFLKILVGILCIIYLIMESAFLTRMFSKNLLLVYFENYPIAFIIFLILFIAVVANIFGRKSIIKSNTIIVPIAILSIFLTSIFVIDLLKVERSLPLFGNGASQIFLSGASNIFAFNGLFFLFFISPMLEKKENLSKVAFYSVIVSGVLLLLSIITLVYAFSDIYTIIQISPIYYIIVNSRLGAFLERPEIIFIFTWILALMSFLSIAVMYILDIFRKITNSKEHRGLSACVCAIIFIVSIWIKDVFTLEKIANLFYKYGALVLIFGVFTIILICANVKKKIKKE